VVIADIDHDRDGLASRVAMSFSAGLGLFGSFPRIAGIGAAGLVVECPGQITPQTVKF